MEQHSKKSLSLWRHAEKSMQGRELALSFRQPENLDNSR